MDHSTCMKDLEQQQKAMVAHEGQQLGRLSFFIISFLDFAQECSTVFICLSFEQYMYFRDRLISNVATISYHIPIVTRLRGLVVYPVCDLALCTPYDSAATQHCRVTSFHLAL